MKYNDKNRELTSATGYIKSKETDVIFANSIFLGIYDTQDNYEEVTKADYEEYQKSLEEPTLEEPTE